MSYATYYNENRLALIDATENNRIIVLDRRPLEAPVFHAPKNKKPAERIVDYVNDRIKEGLFDEEEVVFLLRQSMRFYDHLSENLLNNDNVFIADSTIDEFDRLLDKDKNKPYTAPRGSSKDVENLIKTRVKVSDIARDTIREMLDDRRISLPDNSQLEDIKSNYYVIDKRASDWYMFSSGIHKADELGKDVEFWSQDSHIRKLSKKWNEFRDNNHNYSLRPKTSVRYPFYNYIDPSSFPKIIRKHLPNRISMKLVA